VFHESVNFAALKKLPILFVCENNQYAIYSHVRDRMAGEGLCPRMRTYGIPATRIENGDLFSIHEKTERALGEIRAGEGPRFLECMTYRWRDHVGPGEDRHHRYRPDEELDGWIGNDEVKRLGSQLDAADRARLEAAVEAEIAEAIAFAEASPFPEAEEIADHVFAH
jgi:TPP-dependent pyruvate/acetoin dehydrogenase alpha subunit